MRRFASLFLIYIVTTSIAYSDDVFAEFYETFKSAMVEACSGKDDCLRTAGSLAWFLWHNRDKADIQYNTIKCLGYSAVGRGYVWAPMAIWDDMTPTETLEIAVEVCDCVIGYWGKEAICKKALVEGQTQLLADVFKEP